jgi:hypothetical protein
VTGALRFECWSDVALLALPREGGAFGAGAHKAILDNTAGDIGILAGGVGGTGEAFAGLARDVQGLVGGMVIDGYRFRLDVELLLLFRFESVLKLVGALDMESRSDGHESLNSVSLSLASYISSKSTGGFLEVLALEGEEPLECGDGGKVVFARWLFLGAAMKYLASNPAGLPITVPSSVSVPLPLVYSKLVSSRSSIIVLSWVPRTGRGGAW